MDMNPDIERKISTYEILFRLNKDGSIAGAHRRDLLEMKDNSTGHEFVRELDPQPVEGQAMDDILGVINTSLLKSLATEKEANQVLWDESQNTIGALQKRIEILEGQLTLRATLLEQLTNELTSLKAQQAAPTNSEI